MPEDTEASWLSLGEAAKLFSGAANPPLAFDDLLVTGQVRIRGKHTLRLDTEAIEDRLRRANDAHAFEISIHPDTNEITLSLTRIARNMLGWGYLTPHSAIEAQLADVFGAEWREYWRSGLSTRCCAVPLGTSAPQRAPFLPFPPPKRPRATAAGFFVAAGATVSAISPVARSTMSLASWFASRGRLLERLCIPLSWVRLSTSQGKPYPQAAAQPMQMQARSGARTPRLYFLDGPERNDAPARCLTAALPLRLASVGADQGRGRGSIRHLDGRARARLVVGCSALCYALQTSVQSQ